MKRISFLVLFFLVGFKINGQSCSVVGQVLDEKTKEPIELASALLKNEKEEIVSYTFSDANGNYKIKIENQGNYFLVFTYLGYQEKKVPVNYREGKNIHLNVLLKENNTTLKEVVIHSEKPIIIAKDTVKFKVKYFTKGTEKTVENLLEKIPGIEIGRGGEIRIGGKEIEKLMIDGDDFFEKGYKVVSKNMPAYPVEEVQVLKNYESNRLLKEIKKGGKVALNLKIEEKFKQIWFGNLNGSSGVFNENSQYGVTFNVMNFGKKSKYYGLGNLNNVGDDAGDITGLLNTNKLDELTIGEENKASQIINFTPYTSGLTEERTNFNQLKLVSLSNIYNINSKIKTRAIGFFSTNNYSFLRNRQDVYNLNLFQLTNNEHYSLEQNDKTFFTELDVNYDIAKDKILTSKTRYTNINANDISKVTFNRVPLNENLYSKKRFLEQKINYTNKFNNSDVLIIKTRFLKQSIPQVYNANQFFFENLISAHQNIDSVEQRTENDMLFIGAQAHLLKKNNKNLWEFQLGNEFREDKLSTDIMPYTNEGLVIDLSKDYRNRAIYNENDLYFKTKYKHTFKNFSITGNVNVHKLINRLEDYGKSDEKSFLYINPKIGFNWNINKKNKIGISYSYAVKNAKILDVYKNYILTNYNSLTKGTGRFNILNESSLFLNYQIGNFGDSFLVNTFLFYNHNHDFFSTNTNIENTYTTSEKILIKNRGYLNASSSINYYIKDVYTNFKVNLNYSQVQYKNIINDSELREVKSASYNYGMELRSAFKGFFNYHLGVNWITSKIQVVNSQLLTNNTSFLDLSFSFKSGISMDVKTESYFFDGLTSENRYNFVDFKTNYELIKDKLNIGLIGRNLLNTNSFESVLINDFVTSRTSYRLLPRLVLLNLEYRF
ncbi:TonB-dependent receptor [Tenacibaculum sp. 190524A02b]|uniref:carboxypeptidase-like regulatory domain-containing protein n=1 Tax=Tenacibaculum vairaonense TaxID=3137860 RepID=UPI0032B2BD7B